MKRLKSHFYRFAVLGGDMRQVYLAELLEEKEYQVQRYGLTGGNEKESCSLEAVSYTHLDVYKRQHLMAWLCRILSGEAKMEK